MRRRLGIGDEPFILAVAGLSPIKGIQYVLESLSQLRHVHRFSFIICGEGPQLNVLQDAAVAAGYRQANEIRGSCLESRDSRDVRRGGSSRSWRPDRGFWKCAARSHGIGPASRMHGCGRSRGIRHGRKTGFVVPVADPAAMADKVRLLLVDLQLREELGRQAREW